MSAILEKSQKRGGQRKPRELRVLQTFPCSLRHGLFCKEAWERVAGKLGLSPRHTEVARSALADQSEEDIAQALGVSQRTVHTHVERLHEKLEVHTRVQLVTLVFATYLEWRMESPPPIDCPLRSRIESL